MLPPWKGGAGGTCGRATDRGGWTKTYIKVKGVWTYLYRAVDSLGQTIDFLPLIVSESTPSSAQSRGMSG